MTRATSQAHSPTLSSKASVPKKPTFVLIEHLLRACWRMVRPAPAPISRVQYTILHCSTLRHRQAQRELYTHLPKPDRYRGLQLRVHSASLYLEMQQNGIFRMRYAEFHIRSIKKQPNSLCLRAETPPSLHPEEPENRLYRYIGTYFLYIQFFILLFWD